MHNFTLEDLIAYHYNEFSTATKVAIKAALLSDNQLASQYNYLLSTINSLDSIRSIPEAESMRNIAVYAKKLMEELHTH
jgi:hypothetical protein